MGGSAGGFGSGRAAARASIAVGPSVRCRGMALGEVGGRGTDGKRGGRGWRMVTADCRRVPTADILYLVQTAGVTTGGETHIPSVLHNSCRFFRRSRTCRVKRSYSLRRPGLDPTGVLAARQSHNLRRHVREVDGLRVSAAHTAPPTQDFPRDIRSSWDC